MTLTIRIALATFVVGFLTEAGAELYQFLSYGLDRPGWIGFYYVGLITTGLGFYLMYRGRHEWTDLHHRNVRRSHRLLGSAVVIFVGAVGAIALLGIGENGAGGVGPAPVIEWLVGGLVALSFGNFFLSLVTLIDRIAGRLGRLLARIAFAWSLGVAVLTGFLVGNEFSALLHEFFTNPLGLVISFAPLAFVIAPLFVTYFLFAAAYAEAYRRLRPRGDRSVSAAPPTHSPWASHPPGGVGPAVPPNVAPDEARTGVRPVRFEIASTAK